MPRLRLAEVLSKNVAAGSIVSHKIIRAKGREQSEAAKRSVGLSGTVCPLTAGIRLWADISEENWGVSSPTHR